MTEKPRGNSCVLLLRGSKKGNLERTDYNNISRVVVLGAARALFVLGMENGTKA